MNKEELKRVRAEQSQWASDHQEYNSHHFHRPTTHAYEVNNFAFRADKTNFGADKYFKPVELQNQPNLSPKFEHKNIAEPEVQNDSKGTLFDFFANEEPLNTSKDNKNGLAENSNKN